jgi:hypothetical protein
MKIGDEVYIHGYIDEIRHIQGSPDMIIIRNDGGYFGTIRSEIKADVVPVIHAEWLVYGDMNQCSNCLCFRPNKERFCPNCMAVMEVKDGE